MPLQRCHPPSHMRAGASYQTQSGSAWRQNGGFPFAEAPDRAAPDARIFWRADADPRVVVIDALPAPDGVDALDLGTFGPAALVQRDSGGRERLLLRDGLRTLRLDVDQGTLTEGPVRLRYKLQCFAEFGHRLLTLRRLVALRRLGRFPTALFPPEGRAARWILLLRTLDGLGADASQRELAAGLFGTAGTDSEWRQRSDYLRLRVQRLVRSAIALRDGGYRTLLRGKPPL